MNNHKPYEVIIIYAVLKDGKRIQYNATKNSENIIPNLIKDTYKDRLYGILIEKQKMLFNEVLDKTAYWL